MKLANELSFWCSKTPAEQVALVLPTMSCELLHSECSRFDLKLVSSNFKKHQVPTPKVLMVFRKSMHTMALEIIIWENKTRECTMQTRAVESVEMLLPHNQKEIYQRCLRFGLL